MRNLTKIGFLTITLLSSSAWADTATAVGLSGKQNPMSQFILLGLFMVFLYFMIIRPQTKRAKEHKALIESVAKEDEVVTTGGLIGKVIKVGDHFLTLEISQGVEVHVQKGMVASSLPKGTIKAI